MHDCYAHYGVRNQRFKLIYWYNQGFDLPGTKAGGQEKEWELFDCEKDTLTVQCVQLARVCPDRQRPQRRIEAHHARDWR